MLKKNIEKIDTYMRTLIHHILRFFTVFFLATGISYSGYSQSYYTVSGMKNCTNYIYIGVESNINQFSFLYSSLYLDHDWNYGMKQDTGYVEISVPVKDFEASNPLMYNDFLKLLKAKEYPSLQIDISSRQLQSAWIDNDIAIPKVRITLAGISRTYEIGCAFNNCSNNLYISGATTLRLSDFDIVPPSKLNGLVKVRDEIRVNFGLSITFADTNLSIASN
jgi:hypothetical protein